MWAAGCACAARGSSGSRNWHIFVPQPAQEVAAWSVCSPNVRTLLRRALAAAAGRWLQCPSPRARNDPHHCGGPDAVTNVIPTQICVYGSTVIPALQVSWASYVPGVMEGWVDWHFLAVVAPHAAARVRPCAVRPSPKAYLTGALQPLCLACHHVPASRGVRKPLNLQLHYILRC